MSDASVTTNDLRAFALFADIPDAELGELAAVARRRHLADREVFAIRGDRGDSVAYVVSGRLALSTEHEGHSVILVALGPGDMLGWSMLREDPTWLSTARAVGPVEIVEMPVGRLLDAATDGSPAARRLAQRLIAAAAADLEATRAQLLRRGREGVISAG